MYENSCPSYPPHLNKIFDKNILLYLQTDVEELFNDMKAYWEKPFFTAYKKVDDTYYLIPTKYACDSMKYTLDHHLHNKKWALASFFRSSIG